MTASEARQALLDVALQTDHPDWNIRLERAALVYAWESLTVIKWLDGGVIAKSFESVRHVRDNLVEVCDHILAFRAKRRSR